MKRRGYLVGKGYPEYDDGQARGESGQWTAGGGGAPRGSKPSNGSSINSKYVLGALAGLGLLGAGAAFRFGPRVARYLRTVARGTSKPTFVQGLRRAAGADARRAVVGSTYVQGARGFGAVVGAGARGVGRDARRARAYAERLAQRRRARFMERGHKKRNNHLLKGYPEYDDNQARGEDGTWTGGGGSGGGSRPQALSGFTSSMSGLSSVGTPQQAQSVLKDSVAAYDAVRGSSDNSGVWHNPTILDKAWGVYKNTVLSALGITTLAGVSVVGGAVGSIVGGAHVRPVHSAISAAVMAVAPNTTTFLSYQGALRYLQVLFPKEARVAVTIARFMPLIAGGIAVLGAGLASALTLRYAYRRYQTSGQYRGVSSFNTRVASLDNDISAINSKLDTLTSLQRDLRNNSVNINLGLSTGKALSFNKALSMVTSVKCSDGLRLV